MITGMVAADAAFFPPVQAYRHEAVEFSQFVGSPGAVSAGDSSRDATAYSGVPVRR